MRPIALNKGLGLGGESLDGERRDAACASGGDCLNRYREKLGHLAEVLGGSGKEELVSGTVRTSKTEPVKLQNALEVSEQHLDLPLSPGGDVGVALREIPREIARAFMDRTGDLAGRLARTALFFKHTGPAILLAGRVAHEVVLIDDGTLC